MYSSCNIIIYRDTFKTKMVNTHKQKIKDYLADSETWNDGVTPINTNKKTCVKIVLFIEIACWLTNIVHFQMCICRCSRTTESSSSVKISASQRRCPSASCPSTWCVQNACLSAQLYKTLFIQEIWKVKSTT